MGTRMVGNDRPMDFGSLRGPEGPSPGGGGHAAGADERGAGGRARRDGWGAGPESARPRRRARGTTQKARGDEPPTPRAVRRAFRSRSPGPAGGGPDPRSLGEALSQAGAEIRRAEGTARASRDRSFNRRRGAGGRPTA